MSYKAADPARAWREANPERVREYRQANRERNNAAQRQRRQADPGKYRERERRYREANPEQREKRRIAARRRYWAKHEQLLEQSRVWREANPEKVRENMRRWRAAGGRNPAQRRRNKAVAELWHEQGGICYLCEEPVLQEEVHLDHDHRCCPQMEFCAFCVRGVSCRECNLLVGIAEDAPDRLELIAQNLRAKLAEMDERLAAKPQQLSLGDVS